MENSIYELIVRPIITEKTQLLKETENTFVFEVDKRANKIEIKKTMEKLFSVKIKKVRTLNMHGKPRRLGRFIGKKRDWKKALITLDKSETKDLYEGI